MEGQKDQLGPKWDERDKTCHHAEDFPEFPKPHEPVTKDHIHCFLEKARELSLPNLLVAHSQDAVTAVCLL